MRIRSARILYDEGRSGVITVNGRIAADGDPVVDGDRVMLLLDDGEVRDPSLDPEDSRRVSAEMEFPPSEERKPPYGYAEAIEDEHRAVAEAVLLEKEYVPPRWSVTPERGRFHESAVTLHCGAGFSLHLSHKERFALADALAPEAHSAHLLDSDSDRRWNVVTKDPRGLRLAIGGRWTGPVLTSQEAVDLGESLFRTTLQKNQAPWPIPSDLRDRYLRRIAEQLGEPEGFGAPHWYIGAFGWVLNTGDALLVFGDEASFARVLAPMSFFGPPEKRFFVEGIVAIEDPTGALLFLVEQLQKHVPEALPPREPDIVYDYDVVLKAAGKDFILTVKEIRELTYLRLREAKELAATPDARVMKSVGKDEAERAAEKLRAAGALVEVVKCR